MATNRNQLKSLLGIETEIFKGITPIACRNQLKSLLGIETMGNFADSYLMHRNQLKSLLGIETLMYIGNPLGRSIAIN